MKEGTWKKSEISCWLSYTNSETHRIILENIERSAMYSAILSVSVQDTVLLLKIRFRDLRIGIDISCSLNQKVWILMRCIFKVCLLVCQKDVQEEFYHTIPGLENAEIVRPAYAIEYDCVDPTTLKPSLESKLIDNMFCAGQFNGSSGYEGEQLRRVL